MPPFRKESLLHLQPPTRHSSFILYDEGGAFDFLIDCSPASLMELARIVGLAAESSHQTHLYIMTARATWTAARECLTQPFPGRISTADSMTASSRGGRAHGPSLIRSQAGRLSLMRWELEMSSGCESGWQKGPGAWGQIFSILASSQPLGTCSP